MIWAVAIIEAGFIAVCVYQIRELTSRINTSSDMVAVCVYQIRELTSRINNAADMTCRIIALVENLNNQLQETMTAAKDTGEATVILNGKVANNEHRIRDIYRAINELKGWPSAEGRQK